MATTPRTRTAPHCWPRCQPAAVRSSPPQPEGSGAELADAVIGGARSLGIDNDHVAAGEPRSHRTAQRVVPTAGLLQRAADATHRLGFASAEAHHLAHLGWALQQDGDSRAAITTLERAVHTAHDTGDLRTAALARARLALVLSTLGERAAAWEAAESAQRWYAAAGGGEGALLGDDVLEALDIGADPG